MRSAGAVETHVHIIICRCFATLPAASVAKRGRYPPDDLALVKRERTSITKCCEITMLPGQGPTVDMVKNLLRITYLLVSIRKVRLPNAIIFSPIEAWFESRRTRLQQRHQTSGREPNREFKSLNSKRM